MEVELYHRTYRTYGSSPTYLLACNVINEQLKKHRSDEIDRILVETWSRSLSPPKRSLERLCASYHEERQELPFIRHSTKNREIKVCISVIWPLGDELDRHDQVLDHGLYRRTFGNLEDIYKLLCDKRPKLCDTLEPFNLALTECRHSWPKDLGALAKLYLFCGPPNHRLQLTGDARD